MGEDKKIDEENGRRQSNGNGSHVHELEELILLKYPYYP